MRLEIYSIAAIQSCFLCLLLVACTRARQIPDTATRERTSLASARQARENNAATHFNSPSRVRKMSPDIGEKFWPEYWHFDQPIDSRDIIPLDDDEDSSSSSNHTIDTGMMSEAGEAITFKASCPLHARDNSISNQLLSRWGGAKIPFPPLMKRSFQCPSGTSPCTSIERPNSCCPQDDVCQIVEDTGLGDVGCCGRGQNCSGRLVSCPEGHSSCPDNPGGGCCIPGYSCVDQGCLYVATTTVIVTISPSSTLTSTTTVSESTTQQPPSTVTASPPSRPTSSGDTTTTATLSTTSTSTSIEIPDDCPTGFYACSAVYDGGCCRTGRDCNPTSCPATGVTTITSNDATIVVPVDTTSPPGSSSPDAGKCADGWTSCANDVGGGCCPDGFQCGQVSCTASATGIGDGTIGKTPPEDSGSIGRYILIPGGAMVVWIVVVMNLVIVW